MKLSTRGEYGLRAMFDLSLLHGGGPVTLKSVAQRQGISEHYLEQLMAALRKAGLVRSIRGAQGGYVLGKEPEEIRVGDVIRVLEGPIAPMECVSEEEVEEPCVHAAGGCITKGIWEKVRDSVNEVLDSITLADMCEEFHAMRHKDDYLMYYI